MIVLGDKYDVLEIREAGLSQLRKWYSQDIDQWDARDDNFFSKQTDHLSVAKITRPLNDPWIHAAVIYHCCSIPARAMVYGCDDSPGLCPEDLICVLNFKYHVADDYFGLVSSVFDEHFDEMLSACVECYELEENITTIVDDFEKDGIGYYSQKLIDFGTWEYPYGELKKILCKRCFVYFKSRLRWTRQRYLAGLIDKIQYVFCHPYVHFVRLIRVHQTIS